MTESLQIEQAKWTKDLESAAQAGAKRARTAASERIERERNFHNTRFADNTRLAQDKYYFAIQNGAEAFTREVVDLARGADVLEYGCGDAGQAGELSRVARSVVAIDISEVAIAKARQSAVDTGPGDLRFEIANAEATPFPDACFDLVFGRGIVHHLDLAKCFREVARILKPDGAAIFWEPLGHNAALNLYRALTPSARTQDEHPLLKRDFDLAGAFFNEVDQDFYGLTSLAAVPLARSALGEAVLSACARLDRLLFKMPGLRWQAWYCTLRLRRPVQACAPKSDHASFRQVRELCIGEAEKPA